MYAKKELLNRKSFIAALSNICASHYRRGKKTRNCNQTRKLSRESNRAVKIMAG